MKAQCLAILSLLTHAAWAQTLPQLASPKIIAQVSRTGGLGLPSFPISSTVEILDDGKVQATESYSDDHQTVKQLAVLSPEALVKFKTLVQSTKPGQLVDPSPRTPNCEDAPSIIYYAVLESGEKIAVAGTEACKIMKKDNGTLGDDRIKDILQGFWSLASL